MIAKAGSVPLVVLCALLILPSPAAADTITMRLLGLKDFAPPADRSWTQPASADAGHAVGFVLPTRVEHIGAPTLLLGYPPAIASHRKVTELPWDEFSRSAFTRSIVDPDEQRRRSEEGEGSGGFGGSRDGSFAGGGAGGFGSSGWPSEGRTSSLNGQYGSGGSSGSVLDDQMTLSLENERTNWNNEGGSANVASAFSDDPLEIPQMGTTALLDVKPWVSGFTTVEKGQFVVVDPVTGTPVWTSDPLDALLEHGSLTPLVPTWAETADPSLAAIANPEPASLLLFASGLLTVGARVRAKRRQTKNRQAKHPEA